MFIDAKEFRRRCVTIRYILGKGNHQKEKKEKTQQLIKRTFHGKHASMKKPIPFEFRVELWVWVKLSLAVDNSKKV